jgi:hypothetical protein
MVKLLTCEGIFRLLRGEQEQHGDIHKHFFRQLSKQLPDFRLACNAIYGGKSHSLDHLAHLRHTGLAVIELRLDLDDALQDLRTTAFHTGVWRGGEGVDEG